jgi:phosphoglycolate phosphatase
MTGTRLVIFDVDGTLIDSQAHILAAMAGAFAAVGLPVPDKAATLGIVGLSLPVAMARLAPLHPDLTGPLVDAYKGTFTDLRLSHDPKAQSPLYPGALAVLNRLAALDGVLLGIATGKSRRGLDHVLALHDFAGLFETVQVADDHPSKPHPSMVRACLDATGVDPHNAVIVGDTSFDMEMGCAGGITAVGVSWGYHPVADLRHAGATVVINRFADLPAACATIWGAHV